MWTSNLDRDANKRCSLTRESFSTSKKQLDSPSFEKKKFKRRGLVVQILDSTLLWFGYKCLDPIQLLLLLFLLLWAQRSLVLWIQEALWDYVLVLRWHLQQKETIGPAAEKTLDCENYENLRCLNLSPSILNICSNVVFCKMPSYLSAVMHPFILQPSEPSYLFPRWLLVVITNCCLQVLNVNFMSCYPPSNLQTQTSVDQLQPIIILLRMVWVGKKVLIRTTLKLGGSGPAERFRLRLLSLMELLWLRRIRSFCSSRLILDLNSAGNTALFGRSYRWKWQKNPWGSSMGGTDRL